jgi:3-hydroxybutyryl-CoA dehydrogenase
MSHYEIRNIGVIGAGTMGSGIAQISALAGFNVKLFDLNSEALKKSKDHISANLQAGVEREKISSQEAEEALERILFTHNMREIIADVIIEAVIEDIDVKVKILTQLEQQNENDCIIASNTSSIPITRIASKLKRQDHFIGMHFFNPPHIMKLVEVIEGASTSKVVSQVIVNLAKSLGKIPVMVKDSPGFVVNRVARHFYVEALKILEEDVADHESIDQLMESFGFRMGPFKLMDLIGVDTNFSVTQSMFEAFHQDSKFRPSRIQQQKVDAGHWGRKTGKGFYDY